MLMVRSFRAAAAASGLRGRGIGPGRVPHELVVAHLLERHSPVRAGVLERLDLYGEEPDVGVDGERHGPVCAAGRADARDCR